MDAGVNKYSDWMLHAAVAAALLAYDGSAIASSSATRTSSFAYDSGTGLITKEVVEPGSSSQCLVSEYVYDDYGNKTSATVRNCQGGSGEASAPSGSTAIANRVTTMAYADGYHRFKTSVIKAISQTSTTQTTTYSYDDIGNLTGVTDPNSIGITWDYDKLGRKTKETRPDGTYTQIAYTYCSGVNGGSASCPSNGKYLVQTTVKNSSNTVIAPTVKVYYDALAREIRSETQGFDGTTIYKDTQYDSRGRVSQASEPYFSGSTPIWTQYQYDDLNRPTQITAPNGGVVTTTYNGLTVSATNPLGQTETRIKNSQGQLIEVDR